MDAEKESWRDRSRSADTPSPGEDATDLLTILQRVRDRDQCTHRDVDRLLRAHRGETGADTSRVDLIAAYREFCDQGVLPFERDMLRRLQRKKTRTISGVAPVTVLTEPAFCPGQCIFCPDQEGMPKSYLSDEPGAMRADAHDFDPFDQTAGRLQVLEDIGHSTDKVELLILGGTWSAYDVDYQEWFVRRCFDALNEADSETLGAAQRLNETAPHRNVGLVIETRPDAITLDEVKRLRALGVTKVQLGIQSLDDAILRENRRGHTAEESRQAVRLLRTAGFKIAVHWMPNLLGATPESDLQDFHRLWADPGMRPDELKIYPCLLLPDTELHMRWQRGEYRPYDEETMVELLTLCKLTIPRYCRVNRLMRDIPAPHILEGVRKSNLRQIVQRSMQAQGLTCHCIRCREIRGREPDMESLRLERITYSTASSEEHFLSYVTPEDRLVGFLRLSLPVDRTQAPLEELQGCALIREIHVYGPALDISADSEGEAQHMGLGTTLVEEARCICQAHGVDRLAVIAAAGTRGYYRQRGFDLVGTYMVQTGLLQ